jgi:hypothetical protein
MDGGRTYGQTIALLGQPALKGMDIIAESHECLVAGVTQLLINRFKATHNITLL